MLQHWVISGKACLGVGVGLLGRGGAKCRGARLRTGRRSGSPRGQGLSSVSDATLARCFLKVSRLEAQLLLERYPECGNLLLRPSGDGTDGVSVTTRQTLNGCAGAALEPGAGGCRGLAGELCVGAWSDVEAESDPKGSEPRYKISAGTGEDSGGEARG